MLTFVIVPYMKRTSLIFLTVLYLIPAIGFSIQAHYCGGKLASLSLIASHAPSCPCGSKKKMKNCCKDKNFSFKIKETQQTSSQLAPDFKTFQVQPLIVAVQEFNFQPFLVEGSFYYNHDPPDPVRQSLFLLNRVFRI
jgi:hypothetical protein